MKGLIYQLKNICRDKLCMISFLLPVIVGIALNLLSGVSFSSLGENAFYVLENDLTKQTEEWLHENGSVTVFTDITALRNAVNDPATQAIGVLQDGDGIRTLLSGDELKINTVIGDTLPKLFAQRDNARNAQINITSATGSNDGLTSLLIVITMVTAMFMSCTFNAMSIIGEKEDGIAFINEVLPMTNGEYVVQKITLGFIGGILSTVLTAFICMRITLQNVLPLLLIISFSTFIAALLGLIVGRFSNGLMVGIVCIKLAMILFLAPPIMFYLVVPGGSIGYTLSYLLPSSATFYSLMVLLSGRSQGLGINISILLVHCFVWLLLFFVMDYRQQKRRVVH